MTSGLVWFYSWDGVGRCFADSPKNGIESLKHVGFMASHHHVQWSMGWFFGGFWREKYEFQDGGGGTA